MTTIVEAVRSRARRRPIDVVWLGVVVYATGPVMVAASTVDGPGFSLMRLVVGVPILWALAVGRPSTSTGDPRRARVWTVVGGVSFGMHQLALMTAVKWTSVTDVVLMNTLSPVVVTVLAIPLFGERPGTRFRSWGVLAIVGAVVVGWAGSTGPSGNVAGMGLAALNVVVFSIFFLCSKAARPHVDVWPFLARVITIAAGFVFVFVALGGTSFPNPEPIDWVLATALAIGPGAIGHFLMTWPLTWVPANLPPVLRLVQPFLSGGLAWVLLGQPITVSHLLGGAITVVGVGGALGAWPGSTTHPAPDPEERS